MNTLAGQSIRPIRSTIVCLGVCSIAPASWSCSPTSPTAHGIAFAATSEGTPGRFANGCGGAMFARDGRVFYDEPGCTNSGGRGFNVAAISPANGNVIGSVQNFDTYGGNTNGTFDPNVAASMISFINGQPTGTILLIAVGDDAGLTYDTYSPQGSSCTPYAVSANVYSALEGLGATEIQHYCFRDSYSLIAIKAQGAVAEQLVHDSSNYEGAPIVTAVPYAVATYTLSLPR
jgi:hypothetical protein